METDGGSVKKAVIFAAAAMILSAGDARALDLASAGSAFSDAFGFGAGPDEGATAFRSLLVPSGGRAEAMGTACTALADDISFFDYNPAASSVLAETEAAAWHNSWIADSAVETLAATSRSGNLGYGAQLKCFYVPFSEYNLHGERVAGSYYSETSAALNVSYNFLAGYYFKGIAVGANFRAAWRDFPDYADNRTDEVISGSGLSQSALALMADVGALVRLNVLKRFQDREPNLCVGLSATSLGAALTGFGGSVGLDDPLPTRVSLGVSWRFARPVLVSAEVRREVALGTGSGSWGACAGAEVSVTRFFSVDAGLLVQGGSPRLSMGGSAEISRIRVSACYTFDLASSANPVNHISLSARLRLGDRGRAKVREMVDMHYVAGLRLYAQGNLEEAVRQWDLALALDGRFDPALEAKDAALRFERAKQDIMDMQRFDVAK